MAESISSGPNEAGSISKDCCVICRLGFEGSSVKVKDKGILTLLHYSEKRGDDKLFSYLQECISTVPKIDVLVHSNCRRNYTDAKRTFSNCANDPTSEPVVKKLRSDALPFNWKKDCMLCGKSAACDNRYRETGKVCNVQTLPMRNTLLEHCVKRGDHWASEVQGRLQSCIDLVAEEAVYHHSCLSRFLLSKDVIPKEISQKGRPCSVTMQKWFDMLCQWLESEGGRQLFTVGELHAKMVEFAGESEVYSVKRLKQKLQDHYKGFAFFSEIDGRSNVLCFKNLVDFIINEQWQSEKKANADDEAERIVLAAAKIISAEIRGKKYNIQSYPTIEDISNTAQSKEWIPHYLQTFLKPIISSQLKQTSIGHAIVQASCRSVITPTLFGLGVELEWTKMCDSMWRL